ncbi:olfactory receptor 6B9-like [Discoglossus pictus]
MERINTNNVTEFILVSFPTDPKLQCVLFTVFLIVYVLTILENLVIILTIKCDFTLHKPMYCLLSCLSFLEIWYISVTVPNLLSNFLRKNKTISYKACLTQFYFFMSMACTECILLAVMAFDRYVAICMPLRYVVIMNLTLCLKMAIGSWVTGFSIAMVKLNLIFRLDFCGPNVMNHFFCDISPLLNLSCTDTSFTELVDFILGMLVTMIPLIVIIGSYLFILRSVLKIRSSQGKQKAFSTCASHLTIVAIFYITTLFIYARPKKANPLDRNKLVTIFYSVLTPLINPVIYCLRNAEVHQSFKRIFFKYSTFTENK